MAKHKKLKQKYQSLQNDLYVDEEDDLKSEQALNEQTTNEQATTSNEQQTENTNIYTQPVKRGWRSHVNYI